MTRRSPLLNGPPKSLRPKASFVIPCRDDFHLAATLQSLAAQDGAPSFEVIVVDATTSRDLARRLKRWQGRLELRVVEARGSATPGANRNTGVAASRGALLVFVDADDTVGRDYARAMADALESHAFVCSRIDLALLNPQGAPRTHPQQTGLVTGEMKFRPFAGAGTLGIRRALFEEIGGFDRSIICYEEADLCWRLQLAGHKPPVFVPDATLHCRLEQRRAKRWRKTLVFGETQALLYRRYRTAGMPRESIAQSIVAWLSILSRLVGRVASGQSPAGLGWAAVMRVGRLRGSLRYKVPFF